MLKNKTLTGSLQFLFLLILINSLSHCGSTDNKLLKQIQTELTPYDSGHLTTDQEKLPMDRIPQQLSDCFNNQIVIPTGYDIIACVDKNGMHYPYNNFPYDSIDEFAPHLTIVQNKYEAVFTLEETDFPDYNQVMLLGWEWSKHFDASNPDVDWNDFVSGSSVNMSTDAFTWDINGPNRARLSVSRSSTIQDSWSLVYGIAEDPSGSLYQQTAFDGPTLIANNSIFLYLQGSCSDAHIATLYAELESADDALNAITIELYNIYLYAQPYLSQEEFDQLVQVITAQRDAQLDYVLMLKEKLDACGISLGGS